MPLDSAIPPKDVVASEDGAGGRPPPQKSVSSGTQQDEEDRTLNGGGGAGGDASDSGASLSQDNANAADKKKDDPTQVATVREVFSFAKTARVKACIVLSFLVAAVSGCILPAMAFYFSSAFESLGASPTMDSFMAGVKKQAYAFMALGGIIFVTITIQSVLIETAAAEMTRELKNGWFRALLRQDLAFYDIRDVPGQASLITTSAVRFRKGVGRKLADAVQFTVGFIGSIAYGFIASWQVTLALFAVAPLLVISTLMIIKITTSQTARSTESYAKAGSVVSTTVRSIRTILSLNAVEDMIDRFKAATLEACEISRGSAASLGAANGFNVVSMVLSYMIVTMFGAWLLYSKVRSDGCDPSGAVPGAPTCTPSGNDVFGSLFAVSIAASILPQISIAIEKFSGARTACYPALVAINRTIEEDANEGKDVEKNEIQPPKANPKCTNPAVRRDIEALPKYAIDPLSDSGVVPKVIKGDIEFANVTFAYPARPDVNALSQFSLKIRAGQTVALVGPSGSGKSTVAALLERFYDPSAGSITLDGTDLRLLNVKWLRDQIGLVMQEPKLFGKSIRENIAMGAPGITQEAIEQAARLANAHEFIMSFPKGYDTQVGDLGGMLSGGQRQRIAIARVLARNPSLLILDEATSALDSESEAAVQQALDGVMSQRNATTVVIAHRLSTIKGADVIAVVKDGQIVETGNHSELLAKNGAYASLVEAQQVKSRQEEDVESKSENGSQHESRHDAPRGSRDNEKVEEVSTDVDSDTVFEFKNVHHRYPSRRDVDVFRGLNLTVRKGETLALVGPSGSGKSSVIQLMEHFYEPSEGSILYHGVDLRSINVRWLRSQLGLVSQEAVLFADTIEANIKLGCPGASIEDVIAAAKQANAHDFITSFPMGYQTFIGEGGSLVSGGQKQRIAIARALLRKPNVLLLDEATSALDSKSEKVVQEALDKIMAEKSRTVVVIAHRLSTIRNADRIAVIERGKVKEIGSHDELMMKPDGLYRRLQQMQNLDSSSHGLEARSDLHGDTKKEPDESKPEASEDEPELSKDLVTVNSKRAWELGKAYMPFILIGTVGAVLAGFTFPAWGVIFAYMVELFFNPVACPPLQDGFDSCQAYFDSEANSMKDLSFYLFYGYIGLCVTAVVGNMTLFYGFSSASEKLNKKVRDSAFTSLIRQEVAYFDLRAAGTITSQLADDAAMLHAFAGEPIRTLTVSVSSVVVGLVVSFIFMWPFALLTLGIVPFLAFGAEMEMRTYIGEDEVDDKEMDEHSPGGIVHESLSNIRTVASLTLEVERSDEYDAALVAEDPILLRTNFIKGSLSGVGQFVQMWSWALMFWFGGYLLHEFPGRWSFTDFLISMFALFFSMYGLTLAFQGAVDREKAKKAAQRIFTLTDRRSRIDPLSDEGVIVSDDGTVDV